MLELVEAFYEKVWNAGEDSSELVAPSLRFRGSLGVECEGRAAFADYVRSVRESLADYHCEIVEAVDDGDRCFARMRFSGRHVGTLLAVPATGRTVCWEGAALFHREDGRIARVWVLGDIDALREQLR